MAVIWKLKPFLEHYRIRPATLAQEVRGQLSQNSVYNLVQDEPPARLQLDTLDTVLNALSRLQGRRVELDELLEHSLEPDPEPTDVDAETRAWQEAGVAELARLEPYDWGDVDPMTLGTPLRYDPERGWVEE